MHSLVYVQALFRKSRSIVNAAGLPRMAMHGKLGCGSSGKVGSVALRRTGARQAPAAMVEGDLVRQGLSARGSAGMVKAQSTPPCSPRPARPGRRAPTCFPGASAVKNMEFYYYILDTLCRA
jgi:hypothetical protein